LVKAVLAYFAYGAMNTLGSIFTGVALLAFPAQAQEHRFEDDPI
jgi:hypothetical protein